MRTRRVQKPRRSLVVAGGSGGILRKVSFVLLSGNSVLVKTVFVRNKHCISLCLGYDPLNMCSSVVQHGGMSIARIP